MTITLTPSELDAATRAIYLHLSTLNGAEPYFTDLNSAVRKLEQLQAPLTMQSPKLPASVPAAPRNQ
jgi:hypothetical protein